MSREVLLLVLCLVVGGLRPPGIAGQLFVYPWLGLFPGLALATWFAPRESGVVRAALGLSVSPLITTGIAWFLIRAGLSFPSAALMVAMLGWLGCLANAFRDRGRAEAPPAFPRGVLWWALALAAVLILVPVINPYIYIRGDSWIHGGIVMEVLERGFPPEDPRMAGLPLNYVWFFNFFIALLSSIHRQDPFPFMTLLNAADGFATVVLTALTARRLWGGTRVPLAAAALLTVGLNAGAFLLWPLHLARMWTGEVQGLSEALRLARHVEWNTARVIYSLSAPFAEMVSFLDKLLLGTALNFGYLQMNLFLWALARWLGDARRDALAWLALSAAGMMFFHSVVGLSVLPVALGVLGLAWLARPRWDWLPSRGALVAAAAAAALGLGVALPYTRSITSGWSPAKAGFEHHFIEFNTTLPWTLLTACFFPLLLMRGPVAGAWRERRPLPVLFAAFAIAMGAFACIVHLPEHNAVKFVYEFFTVCVVLAAPAFADTAVRLWQGRRTIAVSLGLLFVIPAALTLRGYLVDPTGRTRAELNPRPGEHGLYFWLEAETPLDAVVVDRDYRDLVAVRARRRLFLGTDQPPERAAFPADEMRRRQAVMADLYGPLAAPDSTIAGLRRLGRAVYVVYRPEDVGTSESPWLRLMHAAPDARAVYEFDGYHVVLLPPRNPS